jgi:hypothetical protein
LSGTLKAELEAFQRLLLELAAGALWDIADRKSPADPERQREQA